MEHLMDSERYQQAHLLQYAAYLLQARSLKPHLNYHDDQPSYRLVAYDVSQPDKL